MRSKPKDTTALKPIGLPRPVEVRTDAHGLPVAVARPASVSPLPLRQAQGERGTRSVPASSPSPFMGEGGGGGLTHSSRTQPRPQRTHPSARPSSTSSGGAGRGGERGALIPVESIEEVWRVGEEWWREAPLERTYYLLLLEGGRPITVFHDGIFDAWFEQRY